jgi:hypothetical protein
VATKKIAFYTMGDTRSVKGAKAVIDGKKQTVKISKMWKLRAHSLAGTGLTYGVGTVDAAILQLQNLAKETELTKVFFIGHGFRDHEGGYMLSGAPKRDEGFTTTSEKTLSVLAEQKMKDFCKKLAPYLSRKDEVEIAFLSCYTGTGKFTGRFYKELRGQGVKKLKVGAYKDFYETVFNTDAKGNITGWADRVVDSKKKVVAKTGSNGIPPYQVTHKEINLDDAPSWMKP